MKVAKNRSNIISVLAAVATIGAFALSLFGVYLQYKTSIASSNTRHVAVTRNIEANISIGKDSRREICKVFSKVGLPDGFFISYQEKKYDIIWREEWKIKNVGTQELHLNAFHRPVTGVFPDSYEVVATSSPIFQIDATRHQVTIKPDLLNPSEEVSAYIYYAYPIVDNNYLDLQEESVPEVRWDGKLTGSSKLDFSINNYYEKLPLNQESMLSDVNKILASTITVWFSDWEIALYLFVMISVCMISLSIFNKCPGTRSPLVKYLSTAALITLAVSSGEVITYLILGKDSPSASVVWTIWMPIVLFQIAIWLYLLKRAIKGGVCENPKELP